MFFIFISCVGLIYADPNYRAHQIEMCFEITEVAMSTFIQTQVFPQPEGTYGTDFYKVRISAPRVELHSGSIVFKATITGYVTTGSMTIPYAFTVNNSINIPSFDLSIQGIIGVLQGIPAQINSQSGPQWLKDIIINAYNNLNLTVYPQRILDKINEPIPDDVDINVNDVTCSFAIEEDVMRVTIGVNVLERAPFYSAQAWVETGSGHIHLRFRSNVNTTILKYDVARYNSTPIGSSTNTGINMQPGTWSQTINLQDEAPIANSQVYVVKVVFGSEFGWTAIRYMLYVYYCDTGYGDLTIAETL